MTETLSIWWSGPKEMVWFSTARNAICSKVVSLSSATSAHQKVSNQTPTRWKTSGTWPAHRASRMYSNSWECSCTRGPEPVRPAACWQNAHTPQSCQGECPVDMGCRSTGQFWCTEENDFQRRMRQLLTGEPQRAWSWRFPERAGSCAGAEWQTSGVWIKDTNWVSIKIQQHQARDAHSGVWDTDISQLLVRQTVHHNHGPQATGGHMCEANTCHTSVSATVAPLYPRLQLSDQVPTWRDNEFCWHLELIAKPHREQHADRARRSSGWHWPRSRQ